MPRALTAWVRLIREHPRLVIALCLIVTAGAAHVAQDRLGINSDTIKLFPEDLPARRNHDAFVAIFPDLENAILIVIDGETSELARDATERIVETLSTDTAHFEDVYVPGGGEFFEHNALLYQDIDDLEAFSDRLLELQPVLAELERRPTIANLAALVRRGLEEQAESPGDDALWRAVLDRVGHASVEVYQEHPIAISWEGLMLQGSAIETTQRRIVLAQPVLDFSDALPGRQPLAAIRGAIDALELDAAHGVRVRVTGNPALVQEETLALLFDIGVSGVLSFVLVSLILMWALRSAPLVLGVVTTLLVGLVWTGGFAALAVGDLNVISVAAGVLFLGLGVDFGIHLAMRYADCLRSGRSHDVALEQAVRDVGPSLVLCTGTTSIGFFAFLPTDYQGVAELGLITGTGLVIILFLTLTLLPALLTSVFAVRPECLANRSLRFGDGLSSFVGEHGALIRRTALVVGLVSLFLAPTLRFDPNIVAMRDPSTESVQAFNDLLEDAGASSPWYANSVLADLAAADAMKLRMRALPVVDRAITLSDYVPDDQEDKLELLGDLAFLFESPPGPAVEGSPELSIDDQIAALRALKAALVTTRATSRSPLLDASVRELSQRLDTFLARVEAEEDPRAALATLEDILLSGFPDQLARLRVGLDAEEITLANLPPRLVHRLISADGRARIQTFPSESLVEHAAFARFVDSVQGIDPKTTGVAVNLVEFARTTQIAFREAIATALVVIALLLWVLWRRLSDTLLVLTPLALASLATAAAMVVIDLPLNFFNVVVVPLLMGAGVDSGIHLVEQSRRAPVEPSSEHGLLATTTARAILYSALTTITSFGTLSLSSHVGISGLGTLLTVGMTLTVVCNLLVLPSLLALRGTEDETSTLRAADPTS